MKVALYARVSSDRQDVDLSISAQLKALREYASKNSHVVVREFVDEAESGRTARRPVFQEMVSLARHKSSPFQAILVWKLSRFARNREDSIIYKSLLRRHGVQVISINEPVESSPYGRMMEGVIEVMDEFHSSNLAQDVVRGMREAASRGYWISARTPYGYRRVHVQDGGKTRVKLEPDPDTAPVVKRIFQMALGGPGVKEIAKTLNAEGIPSPKGKRWGKSGLYVVLTNELYTGTLTWGVHGRYHQEANIEPVRVRGALPAVVDEAAFQQLQRDLKARAPRVTPPRRISSPYLLSGLIRCAGCGTAMFGTAAKSGRFHYYVCATAYRNGRQVCDMKPVPQTVIEPLVMEKVRDLILRQEHIEELVRLTNEELAGSLEQERQRLDALDDQLNSVNRRLERLYDALETGKLALEDLAPRIQDLRKQRNLLSRAREEVHETLEAGHVELVNREEVLGYLKDIQAVLGAGTVAERRTILKSFVERIEKQDSQATIFYSLPLPPAQVNTEPMGVLDTVHYGGPSWTRTTDLALIRGVL
ncbi:MAG: recombinase family protein, partial [Dehalococcoidia bacterium]